jgi:hypothetical protein
VLVLARGGLTAQQQAAVDRLASAAVDPERPANVQVHSLDLEQTSLRDALPERLRTSPIADSSLEQLDAWASELKLDEPLMVAFYPRIWDRIAWQASLSIEHVEQLIDSPLRQEIARRLLDGQSAVWVLLDSGDPQRDDAAWELLQRELVRSSSVVQLPARELIESDEFYRPDVEIDLRVEFTAVRLRADDPAEQAFASLLRGSEPDLREFNEPIAIPLYGRGRTYFALVGAGVTGTTVDENGQFLCGACSCQVKQDNPGLDMLMAVDWAEKVQGTAMPPVVLPELTGIGGLDLAQSVPASTTRATDAATADSHDADSNDPVAADPAKTEHSGPASLERPGDRDGIPIAAPAQDASADAFGTRLLVGVTGGALVALAVLTLATFWLRRTL